MGQITSPAENQNNLFLYAGDTRIVNVNALMDEQYKPDNRSQLVEKYGSEAVGGLSGLCKLTGAVSHNGSNNEVTYWEATRLHKRQDGTIAATTAGTVTAKVITKVGHTMQLNDKIRINGRFNAMVTAATDTTYTVIPEATSGWPTTFAANEPIKAVKIGNEYAQGTNQPLKGVIGNYEKLTNPYIIHKQMVPFTGSELTNGSWISVNGKDAFYSQELARQDMRWRNEQEALRVFASKVTNTTLTGALPDLNGSEGVMDAVKDRGINHAGYIQDLSDFRKVIKAQKKQNSSVSQLAGYFDVEQMFRFNSMVAAAAGSAGTPSYGMFQNNKDMAVSLDYKSISEAGITLHAHEWAIMVDPQWFGQDDNYEKGIIVPMGYQTTPEGGTHPMLELNYKAKDGYSRESESWITGAAKGVYNDSDGYDGLKYNWRTESNIIVRGANTFVRITS